MFDAVHFGAGRIGRGFLGQLLFEAGCRTTFVDTNADLVDQLRARGSYPLRLLGADGSVQNSTVGNITAFLAENKPAVVNALLQARLISTSVGVGILPRIAPLLADGINARAASGAGHINILLCENGWHVAEKMRVLLTPYIAPAAQDYFRDSVGLVECVVGRMVPPSSEKVLLQDALLVVAEPYKELPVKAFALRGPLPPLPGLVLADNFEAYEARKLFLHNMGHAALAYAGWQTGHEFIWQCTQDPDITVLCRAAMHEAQQALVTEYGFDPNILSLFAGDLMGRFANRALGDTVVRVAADPVRKLGPDERLVGAARLCQKHGLKTEALAQVITMALRYDNKADSSAMLLQQWRTQESDEGVLAKLCAMHAHP